MKKNNDYSRYNDIINMPYKKSTKRAQMTMTQRASQFAPFAALTGLEEQMEETGARHEESIMFRDVDEIEGC